jgi:hypothetical protein
MVQIVCWPIEWWGEKQSRVLCGKHWINAKGEGGIWHSHTTSFCPSTVSWEIRGWEQLKVDGCCTVLHKTIILCKSKNIDSFCRRCRIFSLILMGNCVWFMRRHHPSFFFRQNNCHINWGVPVIIYIYISSTVLCVYNC